MNPDRWSRLWGVRDHWSRLGLARGLHHLFTSHDDCQSGTLAVRLYGILLGKMKQGCSFLGKSKFEGVRAWPLR
jgi:small ligand-binding sensory domain FIST